jgi:DNA mismatch endonuclease (patch repair protein)
MSKAARRRVMQAVKGRDTKPEMIVRSLVHRMGYRFRLHRRDLPGTPDLVFPRLKAVIFVHGCFWHRHSCPNGRSMPSTRRAFWKRKLEGNAIRDRRTVLAIRRQGWSVLRVWECELNGTPALIRRMERFLAAAATRLAQEGAAGRTARVVRRSPDSIRSPLRRASTSS